MYANVGSNVSARSYESNICTHTKTGTLFLHDSDHYTVMHDNSSLLEVPITKHQLFKLVPHESYDRYPFYLIQKGVHIEPSLEKGICSTSTSHIRNSSKIPALPQVPNALHELSVIKSLDDKAWYSYSIARYIVSLYPGTKFRLCDSYNLYKPNGIPASRRGSAYPFPSNIDLGYNILSIKQLGSLEGCLTNVRPEIKEFVGKMLSRNNRCLVIHISAVLKIRPLTLEADLVQAALRLLSCTDCHKEKVPILMSILSQDGEVNADIFKLIFPQCLKNVIIRIVKIQDSEPYTQAIAYEDGIRTEHRCEVNLLLNKGHFTI